MYAGTNPKALESQRLIAAAMEGLIAERGFADASVSEVCKRAGVSRQTFYSLFGSKENVVIYLLEHAPGAEEAEGSGPVTLQETCVRFARFVALNHGQLKELVESGLGGVLESQTRRSLASCERSFAGLSDGEREYAADFVAAGLASVARRYLGERDVVDVAELARLAYKMASGGAFETKQKPGPPTA